MNSSTAQLLIYILLLMIVLLILVLLLNFLFNIIDIQAIDNFINNGFIKDEDLKSLHPKKIYTISSTS